MPKHCICPFFKDYLHTLSARVLKTRILAGGAAAANSDGLDRNALQLQLQDLRLDNVDALEALKLNIQVFPYVHAPDQPVRTRRPLLCSQIIL